MYLRAGRREEFFPTAKPGSPRVCFFPVMRIGFCHAAADCVSPVSSCRVMLFLKEGDVARELRVTNQMCARA